MSRSIKSNCLLGKAVGAGGAVQDAAADILTP